MLLVIIFLLSVFMLAQFFLSREVTGKDTALAKLNHQIEELTSLLAMERTAKNDAQANLAGLSATLEASQKEQARLQGIIAQGAANADAAGGKASAASSGARCAKGRLRAGARAGRHSQSADLGAAPAARGDRGRARRFRSLGQGCADQDRRSRLAPQYRARAESAGIGALSLRLLRPPAPDPRRAARHQRRRRPLRVRILRPVRIRPRRM